MTSPNRKRRDEPYTLDWVFDRAIPEPNSGCWIWTGGINAGGYGTTTVAGVRGNAHRLVLGIARDAPVPTGMDLDHRCRTRACVNPDHMEVVSRAENIRRGDVIKSIKDRASAINQCRNGHPLSGENLYLPARGKRECKECRRANVRRWYQRRASIRNNLSF